MFSGKRRLVTGIIAASLLATMVAETRQSPAAAKSIESASVAASVRTGPYGPVCTSPSATTIQLVNDGVAKTYSLATLTACASYVLPSTAPVVTPTPRASSTPTATPSPIEMSLPSPGLIAYTIGANPVGITAMIAGDILTVSTTAAETTSTLEILATHTYQDSRETSHEYTDTNTVSIPLAITAPAATTPPTTPETTAPAEPAAPAAPNVPAASGPRSCGGWEPKTETIFNNPLAGSSRDDKLTNSRFAITNRIIRMIDCAPVGSTIAMSWFSFTDENLVSHLIRAHQDGVNVRVLVNSHATRPTSSSFNAVSALRSALGSNITAATANASENPGSWIGWCNSGCLTPAARAGLVFPDESESEYPALHSKFFMFSRVSGAANIVGISSINPTYEQARVGFNNASVVINDKKLFASMNDYYSDLSDAARGAGKAKAYRQLKSDTKSTSYYVYPKSGSDDVLKMLRDIKCIYKEGGKTKRTEIYVNMFVFTRNAPAMELWNKAFASGAKNGGCKVNIIYTDMDQRIKALNTRTGQVDYIPNGSRPSTWGVADCLSTMPSKKGKAQALTGPSLVFDAGKNRMVTAKVCKNGSLQGAIPTINKPGGYCWFNATNKSTGGSLSMCVSTPLKVTALDRADNRAKLEPVADASGSRWYSHQKYIAIDGMYGAKGKQTRQKIVISGTPNITSPGQRWNDEILTFTRSPKIYAQYVGNFNETKRAIMNRPGPSGAWRAEASW
jgi:phosphatidylserine/phosphatidylglycerophosphate/cardiolipin synthase-like enzyme